jgi:putative toxin-antitoxin system antitoxin component (TIGR02293 family)
MKKYKDNFQDSSLISDITDNFYISNIQKARKGVPFSKAITIADQLNLTMQELADILHVSLRTLQRYDPNKIMDVEISTKILRLESLALHGAEVFGKDYKAFAKWLRLEVPALEGKSPISYLDTSFGLDWIDQILGQIEHGIFA